jgi:hypothetical protein
LTCILASNSSRRVKKLLLENLINSVKDIQDLSRDPEYAKCRGNYEVLSTGISDNFSIIFQMEKDVEEL